MGLLLKLLASTEYWSFATCSTATRALPKLFDHPKCCSTFQEVGMQQLCKPVCARLHATNIVVFPHKFLRAHTRGFVLAALPALFTLLASGRWRCWVGIQLSSYALAPLVTAGPSAPTTETWLAGSTFFERLVDVFARSPPFPPRRF